MLVAHNRFSRSLLAAVLVAVLAATTNAADAGSKVDNFTLPDIHGRDRSLAELADKQVVVVAFVGTECPVARLYAPRLEELAQAYAGKGVAFVGVDANSQDTLADMLLFYNQFKFSFPLLKDRDQSLADKLGVVRNPEVFVLDRERKIRYRGRIDDQFGVGPNSGYAKPEVKDHTLTRALDELIADKPVSEPATQALGCLIGRSPKAEPKGDITYSKHIAALMQDNCVVCHRPGQIGPFTLTDYDQVAGWGPMMKEVIAEGRMPPWSANPEFGKFKNDCRLSEADKQMLYTWVDNGCPPGNPADLPPTRTWTEGWQIGEPDVVLTMRTPFSVPAEGVVEYQNFIVDPGWTEGRWVQAAEARPGNRSVVHHIIVSAVSTGKDGEQFTSAMPGVNAGAMRGQAGRGGLGVGLGGLGGGLGGLRGGPAGGGLAGLGNGLESILDQILGNSVTIFVPGYTGTVHVPGSAYWVPAGSKICFQLHYTPNGKVSDDQSSVAIKFADPASVKKKANTLVTGNPLLMIPAGAENYKVTSRRVIPKDKVLLSLSPHMHARGKSFRYEAVYPDGKREVLLDVPKYDFNWQIDYKLAEPKLLPAGTAIECTAYFDNSENNPANPNPKANVRFGMQTWEEMMIGFYATLPVEDDVVK